MLYGVKINNENTLVNYGLCLLADVSDQTPTLQEKRYQIPGRNGTVNASYALTGYPIFNDRMLTFTLFKSAPDPELQEIRAALMAKYQGTQVQLIMPWDEDHYFEGVIMFGQISGYNTGRIPVTMVAAPYRKKLQSTQVTQEISTSAAQVVLQNEGMPTIPTFTATTAAQITVGRANYSIEANTPYTNTALQMTADGLALQVHTLSGTGTLTITYQEGTL